MRVSAWETSAMIQIARLRRLADNCLMLSSAARDATARADILACAAEYRARAAELEARVACQPKARQEVCS